MLISIDFESDVPLYTQLKSQIVQGIASGRLIPGEPLPSVRQMAVDLGINMHTVNKTYALLKNEGYTVIHKRRGVMIASLEQMKESGFGTRLEQSLRPLAAEAICKGVGRENFTDLCTRVYRQMKGGKSNA